MSQYTQYTVSVTNNSAVVTGATGTKFITKVAPGNAFKIKNDVVLYQVSSVDSDTQLTLTAPYKGSTAYNVQYQVTTDYTPNFGFAEVNVGDQDWPVHLTTNTIRKIDQVLGGLASGYVIKGEWNASTNTPAIPSASEDNANWLYRVSESGSTNVNGLTLWLAGDSIISNGSNWFRVPSVELALTYAAETAVDSAAIAQVYAASAGTSASNAAASKTSAAISEVNAAAAADSLSAALTAFRRTFIGYSDTDPLVDGNGDPLLDGATYVNTITDKIRVYSIETHEWNDYDEAAQAATTSASLSASNAAASAISAEASATLASINAATSTAAAESIVASEAAALAAAASAASNASDILLAAADVASAHDEVISSTNTASNAALEATIASEEAISAAEQALAYKLAAQTSSADAVQARLDCLESEQNSSANAIAASVSEDNAALDAYEAALSQEAAAASEADAALHLLNAEAAAAAAIAAKELAVAANISASSAAILATASESAAEIAKDAAAASAIVAADSATLAGTTISTITDLSAAAAASADAAAASEMQVTADADRASSAASLATTKTDEAIINAANAAISAIAAASSASISAQYIDTAALRAQEANTSAQDAQASRIAAGISADLASDSKYEAAAHADTTSTLLDSFNQRYLGEFAVDPVTTYNGNTILPGSLYYYTDVTPSNNIMKVYNGSSWEAAYASSGGAMLAENNLADLVNTEIARSNLGLGSVENTTLSTWIGSAAISTVGTIGVGTWQAATLATLYGGTGLTVFAPNSAIFATTADTLVSGTLPVVCGGTGTTTSTGSGSVVKSESPTLTTPNIGEAVGTSFNNISGLADYLPSAGGVAAIGSSTLVARGDHVHAKQDNLYSPPASFIASTAAGISASSCVQIREAALVGNTMLTPDYSPRLGFVWNSVASGSIAISSGGTFGFFDTTGSGYADVYCKILNATIVNGGMQEADPIVGTGTITIDYDDGSFFSLTATQSTSVSFINFPSTATSVIVCELNNFGAYPVLWSGVKWSNSTVPLFTSAGKDLVSFIISSDGVIRGVVSAFNIG